MNMRYSPRDAADNMPAVNAIKLLEELGDDHSQRQSGLSAQPGVSVLAGPYQKKIVPVRCSAFKAVSVGMGGYGAVGDLVAVNSKIRVSITLTILIAFSCSIR
jgi:hypothetical protein